MGGGMKACEFCRIVQGEIHRYVVFEDEVSMGFLDDRPLFPGHVLLIPREHYETLADLPRELVAPLFLNARLLARAVEEGLGQAPCGYQQPHQPDVPTCTCTWCPGGKGRLGFLPRIKPGRSTSKRCRPRGCQRLGREP
jgi:hypothetical protein